MITVDLITGFLGCGKTTFLKIYAKHFLDKGERVGVLENDYGAVNVDLMLLSELGELGCELETVAGACDYDCHKRRFKTKLIAMGMSGLDRVIIEPSGVFDVDEFFDTLREEPLERWYQIGSVITVIDPTSEDISDTAAYLLASQAANAGQVVLSKTQLTTTEKISEKINFLNQSLGKIGCNRRFAEDVMKKPWSELNGDDIEAISKSGWHTESFIKLPPDEVGFSSLYFMNTGFTRAQVNEKAKALFEAKNCGEIRRVKGFVNESGQWYEFNSTGRQIKLSPIKSGQDIVIVIGENLVESEITKIVAPTE